MDNGIIAWAKRKTGEIVVKKGSKMTKEAIEKDRQAALARPPEYYPRGEKHYNWNGGRYTDSRGYVLVRCPNHPRAIRAGSKAKKGTGGYVFEHILVMEKTLGRFLLDGEQIHHRNQIKNDNRPENLELMIKTKHFGKVICPYCQKEFVIK